MRFLPTSGIESSNGTKLNLLARRAGDGLYLFAVNYDERARESLATMRLAGLAAGTAVSVVDEELYTPGAGRRFYGHLWPPGLHIYRLP